MTRLVIVGEAPGPRDGPGTPLQGVNLQGTGGRLRALCGLTEARWRRVERVNLLPFCPGGRFPAELAASQAANLSHSLLRSRRLVLLGRRVALAFGVPRSAGREYAEWTRSPLGPEVAVIPHPSGKNLWYNDSANRRRVERFLRGALAGKETRCPER